MKLHLTLLTALSVLCCFVSCSRKADTPAPVLSHDFRIEACLPELGQDADVKGSLESFISASWTAGDELSVVNLTTGKVLAGTLAAAGSGSVTTFSGSVTGSIHTGDRISLIYPAIENASGNEIDFVNRTVSVAAQDKSSGVPLVADGTFTASSVSGVFSDMTLNFEYGVSYLKLNLANLPAVSGGCEASKITVRNVSNCVTYSIDAEKEEFVISTPAEKAFKGSIELTGPFSVSENGTLMVCMAVAAADTSSGRMVEVSITEDGDYSSSMTSAELKYNRYYNTIASRFEKTGIYGVESYGVYDLASGAVLDQYQTYGSTIISGTEAGEKDFTVVQNTTGSFWTIKGLPASAQVGDTFTARFLSNKVEGFPTESIEGAKVFRITEDGDFSKLWVTAHTDYSDYLFIIRK